MTTDELLKCLDAGTLIDVKYDLVDARYLIEASGKSPDSINEMIGRVEEAITAKMKARRE
jgi:predicted secreted protein